MYIVTANDGHAQRVSFVQWQKEKQNVEPYWGEKLLESHPLDADAGDAERRMIMEILRIIFPALMVVGALGSLIVNIIEKGNYAISIQWIGAALLYTALMLRNMTK